MSAENFLDQFASRNSVGAWVFNPNVFVAGMKVDFYEAIDKPIMATGTIESVSEETGEIKFVEPLPPNVIAGCLIAYGGHSGN